MTYCVGLCLRAGVVMLSDTRTNAGLDNISSFSKMHTVENPGERAISLMTAGNLAITQSVWAHLQHGVALNGQQQKLSDAVDMFAAAQLVGAAIRAVNAQDGPALSAQGFGFECSFLLGGQIRGGPPRLFLIYAAGNFIEATEDTCFLQIGEHKYGKPILDRVLTPDTTLSRGVALTMISMDSTIRSNLSVGAPLDLAVIPTDRFEFSVRRRLTEEDPYFRMVREGWSGALRQAYLALPEPGFMVG